MCEPQRFKPSKLWRLVKCLVSVGGGDSRGGVGMTSREGWAREKQREESWVMKERGSYFLFLEVETMRKGPMSSGGVSVDWGTGAGIATPDAAPRRARTVVMLNFMLLEI